MFILCSDIWHTCSALAARKYWRSEINIKHQYYCAALVWQAYSSSHFCLCFPSPFEIKSLGSWPFLFVFFFLTWKLYAWYLQNQIPRTPNIILLTSIIVIIKRFTQDGSCFIYSSLILKPVILVSTLREVF